VSEPFDQPDWVFELKHDGFRALARVNGHRCELVSSRGHLCTQFPMLQTELARAVRAMSCFSRGEIVCLAPDGGPRFYDLLFRRQWPSFITFEALMINGQDLRERPLLDPQ
jgi:bifunctional non-homologous end joining protein LigD